MPSVPGDLLSLALWLSHRRRSSRAPESRPDPLLGLPGQPVPALRLQRRHGAIRLDAGGAPGWRLRPGGAGIHRRVLYLHGGGFVNEILPDQWRFAAELGTRLGATVDVPLYPLVPGATHREAMAVLLSAYRRLLDERPSPVWVAGDSAGAWLALSLHTTARAQGLPSPAGFILISPWLDLTLSSAELPALAAKDALDLTDRLRATGAAWAGEADPADAELSPLRADLADLPPTVVVAGTRDIGLADARELARRASASEAPVRLYVYEGMIHGFPLVSYLPEAHRALRRIAETVTGSG